MKIRGTNIIFLNESNAVLLQLRDDKPNIPYPNMWALPGGHIGEHETPKECIIREIKEELGVELNDPSLFIAAERSYGTEYTYWARANFSSEDIILSEGQKVKWCTHSEIKNMRLIYEDNDIIDDFFKKRPFATREYNMFEEILASDFQSTAMKKLSLQSVPLEPTRHGALKRVLLRHEDVCSQVMFLNEVYVMPGECLAAHSHEDMEEIFYFLEGKGIMQVGQDVQSVIGGDRVIVPIKTMHFLENTGETEMRFICFGVKCCSESEH